MEDKEIQRLTALLNERTMALMERESDLADQIEEIEAQKEELSAAVEELQSRNSILEETLDELKEKNEQLDQILYRASHDLRTPVAAIVGILDVLEFEPFTSIQKNCYGHIREKSRQMDEILKSLSALSRSLSEDVRISPVNIEQLVRECVKDLQHTPNFSSLAIRTEIKGSVTVNTDQHLLGIIIRNVLANAITFRNPEQAGRINIQTTVMKSSIELKIADDGEGVPDDIKDRIFQMFYRGSYRSTGSGLGLYVVRKILDLLQGHIQFTVEDRLTLVTIVVPVPPL